MDKNQIVALIAKRVAQEVKEGDLINLGIGIPTQVANYIPAELNVTVQSENGLTGVGNAPEAGKEDKDLINAGGGYVTVNPGAVYFDSALSFAIIRGGHLDITVLGTLEVDQKGNIANWIIPGKMVPGMGGAMDLCTGAKKVIAAFQHCDKKGNSKILKECKLPLTARGAVDLIVTEMAVMEVTDKGLVLKEVASWTCVDDVIKATEAELIIPENVGTFE